MSSTAEIFNGAVAATAIAAGWEVGLLDAVCRDGEVLVTQFCDARDLHHASIRAMVQALACFDIVRLAPDGRVEAGSLFEAAYREKGYFFWLVRGYGEFWQHFAELCVNANREPGVIRRDPRHIAVAGRDYGAEFVDPHFELLVAAEPFHVAADLGCGSAARLIALIRNHSTVRGIGVEVSSQAVAVARQAVAAAGLNERIEIIAADVLHLSPHPTFADVDLLFCFFMGHDLWPRHRCTTVLCDLQRVFPSVRRFLLCDTFRSDAAPSPTTPIFQLGFEWTHAVMGQMVPSRAEWDDVFEGSGWTCMATHPIGIASSAICDLRPASRAAGSSAVAAIG